MDNENSSNGRPVLTMYENRANRHNYEEFAAFKNSFFNNVYNSAAKITSNIIMQTQFMKYENLTKKETDFQVLNNIISFIGDRGAGKSSAMLSYSDFLRNFNREKLSHDSMCGALFDHYKQTTFVVLDAIDPTLLDEKESIFELVIAKMFNKLVEFSEHHSKPEFDVDSRRNKLIKEFDKMYRTIKAERERNSNKQDMEGSFIEMLDNLCLSSNKRKIFMELVKTFLDYVDFDADVASKKNAGGAEHHFLVIVIDDLDMNVPNVFAFSEEIRKYLMIPNVIILMSFKYEQYKSALLNHYLELDTKLKLYYSSSIKKNPEYYDGLIRDQYHFVSEYLEKMFPLSQKITLPSISFESKGYNEDIDIKYFVVERDRGVNRQKLVHDRFTLRQFVFFNLFDKTRIRLAFPIGKHPFDMDNLRELHNYVKELNNLSAYRDPSKMPDDKATSQYHKPFNKNGGFNYANCLNNIDWFADDLVNRWSMDKLHSKGVDLLHKLQEVELEYKNVVAVDYFYRRIDSYLEEHTNRSEAIKKKLENRLSRIGKYISKKEVTLGRLLEIINFYAGLELDHKNLAFATLALYTTYLKRFEKKHQNGGSIKELNKNISLLTKNDFYGTNSCYVLPFLDARGTIIPFGRIEGIKNAADETPKWMELLLNDFDDINRLCLKHKYSINKIEEICGLNQEFLCPEDEKILAEKIIQIKKFYNFEELAELFNIRNNESYGSSSFTFDVLNVFVACTYYEERFDNYKSRALSTIADADLFFDMISCKNQMDQWKNKNKNLFIVSPFPILDVLYTQELIDRLSYSKPPIDARNFMAIAEALKKLYCEIYEFIKQQENAMFKNIEINRHMSTLFSEMFLSCPIIHILGINSPYKDIDSIGSESISMDFFEYLAKKICSYIEGGFVGYIRRSDFNLSLRSLAAELLIEAARIEDENVETPYTIYADEIDYNRFKENILKLSHDFQSMGAFIDNFTNYNYNAIDGVFTELKRCLKEYKDPLESRQKDNGINYEAIDKAAILEEIFMTEGDIQNAKKTKNNKLVYNAYESAFKFLNDKIKNIVNTF